MLPFRPVRSSVCSAMGLTLPMKLCRERAVDQGATRRVTPLNALSLHYFHSLMTSCPKATFRDSLIKSSRNVSRSSRVPSPLIRSCRPPPPRTSARNLRLQWLHPPLQSPTSARERTSTLIVLLLPLRLLKALLPCPKETSSIHSLRRAIFGTICG